MFTSNTLATIGLKHIHAKEIKIPDDLSIVTFDEMDSSDLFYAPLTYLRQPIEEMGQIATKILLETIDEKKEIVQMNMEATLIIRKSTLPVQSK